MASSKKYILLVIVVIIVALAGIGFYNRELIKAYYTDVNKRPFKSGDKVYAIKAYSIMNDTVKFRFFRLIKSTTSSEQDMLPDGTCISVKSFKNKHSTGLGSFIERKFLPLTDIQSGKAVNFLGQLYAIVPDKNLIELTANKRPMPAGFEYANDKLYVFAVYTSTKNEF
jgi:hypothetical protein